MNRRDHSSGDVLADRRFGYAEALLAEGDLAGAVDLLTQTLELVPGWAPAWMALAMAEERQNQLARAREAYSRAEACDQDGHLGASLHLARLDGRATPPAMPPAYVASLFDDYAPRFDRHLIDELGYRGPAILMDALHGTWGDRRFRRALDLGCGTGLMGAALARRADRIEGVDLSPAMVERAAASGFYERLVVGEIGHHLDESAPAGFDLVVAADVFVYLGGLGPVVEGIARVLAPGGVLAFTTQKADTGAVRLGDDLRFSHSADHIRAALNTAGLGLELLAEASTRREAGKPVPGLVVVAQKPYL